MIAVCIICDHKNDVPEGMTEIICEHCLTELNVYEDGTTDVM
jgi:hypothetical protein